MSENHDHIMETLERVLEKQDETRGCINNLDKKIDLHIQKTELELEYIRELDKEQNELLDEHAKRSNQLERDNQLREASLKKEFEDRFQSIEKPREWLKQTGKMLFWLASSAGAMYGAYEFYSWISTVL